MTKIEKFSNPFPSPRLNIKILALTLNTKEDANLDGWIKSIMNHSKLTAQTNITDNILME